MASFAQITSPTQANIENISKKLLLLVNDEDRLVQFPMTPKLVKQMYNLDKFVYTYRCHWCATDGEFSGVNQEHVKNTYLNHVKTCKLKNHDTTHIFCPFCPKFGEPQILNFGPADPYVSEGFTDDHFIKNHPEIYNSFMESIKEEHKPKTPRKKSVPAALKKKVWNKYIGEEIGKTKCTCCKLTDITQISFHCGHIISTFNGGKTSLTNLKPICQNCNSSMATTNMDEFIATCGF